MNYTYFLFRPLYNKAVYFFYYFVLDSLYILLYPFVERTNLTYFMIVISIFLDYAKMGWVCFSNGRVDLKSLLLL
jgi:hypothetical protein